MRLISRCLLLGLFVSSTFNCSKPEELQCIKQAFSIITHGHVHEQVVEAGVEKAGLKDKIKGLYLGAMIIGVQWPDIPCEKEYNIFTKIQTCAATAAAEILGKKGVGFETHYGEKQIWHSMSPGKKYTNQEVLELIMAFLKGWYENALLKIKSEKNEDKKLAYFEMGRFLHTIHDSFSIAHTIRDKEGKLLMFQNYNAQDGDKHAVLERVDPKGCGSWQEIPGNVEAVHHTAEILKLFEQRKSFADVEKYMRKNVFNFAEGKGKVQSGEVPEFLRKKE